MAMKKVSLIALVMALLLAAVLPATAQPLGDVASISPSTWDFGEVPYGETRTVLFTVTNISEYAINVHNVWGELTDNEIFFSGISLPLGTNLGPGQSVDIEVTFRTYGAGSAPQLYEQLFYIEIYIYDDAAQLFNPWVTGTAVPVKPTPGQQIADILAFFDASVEAGTLLGSGPGASAPNRLKALRNMIVSASDLINQGKMTEACQQLRDVYNRTDGLEPPPDFVKGTAASNLASMIKGLRANLNCP
jgi:hypothetical protein